MTVGISNRVALRKIQSKTVAALILAISLPAVAVTNSENTAAETAINTDVLEVSTEISQPQAPEQVEMRSTAVRQQLQQVITSEDYATSKSYKQWQRKQTESKLDKNSWIVKLLKFLFDWDLNSDDWFDLSYLQIIAIIIKTILIAALLLLIVWIIRHAQKNRWLTVTTAKKHHKPSVSIKNLNEQLSLADIPTHQQLGITARQLIQQGQLGKAASMLYRGSLRWLANNQLINVAPATTEMQCLDQLQQINHQFEQSMKQNSGNKSFQQNITVSAQNFINQIIQSWMLVAYDTASMHTDYEALSLQLSKLADEWLSMLPETTSTANRFNQEV